MKVPPYASESESDDNDFSNAADHFQTLLRDIPTESAYQHRNITSQSMNAYSPSQNNNAKVKTKTKEKRRRKKKKQLLVTQIEDHQETSPTIFPQIIQGNSRKTDTFGDHERNTGEDRRILTRQSRKGKITSVSNLNSISI